MPIKLWCLWNYADQDLYSPSNETTPTAKRDKKTKINVPIKMLNIYALSLEYLFILS